jgi:hypothetical protein
MAVSPYSSINRWSHVYAKKHQSTLNDFLTGSPWEEHMVHSQLSRLTVRRIKDFQIGIIDDTMSHKPYAKKMDHLGYFRSGVSKDREKGHSIVTHGLHSREVGFVPFDIQLYRKNDLSKNDIACAMIDRTKWHKNVILYIVDSWYSGNRLLNKVKSVKSHFITEIKSNRNVTINYKSRFVREHAQNIEEKDFKETKIKGSRYRFFQVNAFIKGLNSTNLVFSQKFDEKEGNWGEFYYLITDILNLSGERVIELFLVRGGIEGFHREAKQQLGLESYQLRKARGIERYLFLVLLVYALLMLLIQQHMRRTFEVKTIGEMCRQLKAECYTTLLQNAKHSKGEFLRDFCADLALAF